MRHLIIRDDPARVGVSNPPLDHNVKREFAYNLLARAILGLLFNELRQFFLGFRQCYASGLP